MIFRHVSVTVGGSKHKPDPAAVLFCSEIRYLWMTKPGSCNQMDDGGKLQGPCRSSWCPRLPEALALLDQVEPTPSRRSGRVWRFGNPAWDCRCAHCVSPGYRGQPINSIKRSFVAAACAAGLRDMDAGRLRIHDLRHTFASWLLDAGGDLKLVQEALGHSDVKTTTRYAHLMPGRKEQAMRGAVAGLFQSPREEKEAG